MTEATIREKLESPSYSMRKMKIGDIIYAPKNQRRSIEQTKWLLQNETYQQKNWSLKSIDLYNISITRTK